jgi:hypothetical protein
MRPSLRAVAVFALLISPPVAPASNAQEIPNSVRVGQRVSIVDTSGAVIEGRVEGISQQGLRISAHGATTEIAVGRILRIDQQDGLKNGALIGLAVGLGLGTLGGAMDDQGRGRRATFVPVAMLGNGLISTALGALIDALVDNRRTLYQRPRGPDVSVTPTVQGDMKAISLSLSW